MNGRAKHDRHGENDLSMALSSGQQLGFAGLPEFEFPKSSSAAMRVRKLNGCPNPIVGLGEGRPKAKEGVNTFQISEVGFQWINKLIEDMREATKYQTILDEIENYANSAAA